MPQPRCTRSCSLSLRMAAAVVVLLTAALVSTAGPAGAVTPPTVAANANFAVLGGQAEPLGDLSVTEASPGQLQLGDVLTFRFEDGASAATLHFATAGTVGGTNGLAATVALASSNTSGPPLEDEMKVTITATSATSSFPGVLTLSGLNAAIDAAAATGNDKVLVSDADGTISGTVTVADANVLSSGTLRAPYAPQSAPTILPTSSNQAVGSVAVTEPVKSYFHTGDVVTFQLRDANGSADTVGLATAPYAAGGSMTVDVTGVNGPSVQTNDTAFNVDVVAGDPSNGSASTILVTNLVVNTAQAPVGPVTLSASVTAGPDVGTDFVLPGRVSIAVVGGTTTTTAVGAPTVALSTTAQTAGDVRISMTAGSVAHDDTISTTIETSGVTFTAATPPIATVTSGSVVFTNAQATLSNGGATATWTVATGAVTASTVELAPIVLDVSGTPTPGSAVQMLVAGQAGSDFTSQVVSDATIASATAPGDFATNPATLPSISTAPFDGASVTYTETAGGATAVGYRLVLLSPYATQIAAYRTTFSAVPTALATGGLVLGAATVNTSAIVVATPSGTVTAPPQTAAIFPVATASSSASTVTFSNLAFDVGSLVPPGALLVTGVAEQSAALTTALAGNQVVDLIDTAGLGTSQGTTPPIATITEQPPVVSNSTSATFAFTSDQADSTFACSLDGVVVSLVCPTPLTLPGLADGSHTFTVQAINVAGFASVPVSYTWSIETVAPTAVVTAPTAVTGAVGATFSQPVTGLEASTVVLQAAPASGPPVTVTASLTCTTAPSVTVPCTPTTVSTAVTVQPTTVLVPGQHYTLTLDPAGAGASITDAAGNALATTVQAFRPGLTLLGSTPAASGTWATVLAKGASGGSYAVADVAGGTASLTFTGTSVGWLTETGPKGGVAALYVDGTLRARVNTYSASPRFRVLHTVSGLTSGTHTVEVAVTGAVGAKGGGTQVALDAFVVGSTTVQQSSPSIVEAWGRATGAGVPAGAVAADLQGSRYTLGFRGVSITWRGVVGPAMGELQVLLDGRLVGTVDGYAARGGTVAHTISALSDGVHTLTFVVLGRHDATSKGTGVGLAGFQLH